MKIKFHSRAIEPEVIEAAVRYFFQMAEDCEVDVSGVSIYANAKTRSMKPKNVVFTNQKGKEDEWFVAKNRLTDENPDYELLSAVQKNGKPVAFIYHSKEITDGNKSEDSVELEDELPEIVD